MESASLVGRRIYEATFSAPISPCSCPVDRRRLSIGRHSYSRLERQSRAGRREVRYRIWDGPGTLHINSRRGQQNNMAVERIGGGSAVLFRRARLQHAWRDESSVG